MFKKLFLIYCLFTFLLLFSFMEKTDQKLIKIVLKNPEYLEYIIIKLFIGRKYTPESYPIAKRIFSNKHFLRIIYIILIIFFLLLAPIINLISVSRGYPYTFGLKYPLSIDGRFFYAYVPLNNETPQYLEKCDSKLFWLEFFEANNVNTPKVYGTIKDGVFTGAVPSNKKLIWKLIYGDRGIGLQKFTSMKDIPKKGYYILQELIPMCDGHASHLRITTVSNKTDTKIFEIKYYKQPNKNKITSNRAQGGEKCSVENKNCTKDNKILFEMPQNVMSKLEEVKEIAIKLHKQLESHVFSWDIIFTCDNYYFLEANINSPICYAITSSECMEDYINFMFSDL